MDCSIYNGSQVSSKTWHGSSSFHRSVGKLHRSAFGELYAYKEIKQIGRGGFGNCFLLERKSDGAQRVCKVQERRWSRSQDDYEALPLEVGILRDILPQHERIIQLHEVVTQTHNVQLYFDYCEGGDLAGIISRYYANWLEVPETFMWHALRQLSEAIAFLQ